MDIQWKLSLLDESWFHLQWQHVNPQTTPGQKNDLLNKQQSHVKHIPSVLLQPLSLPNPAQVNNYSATSAVMSSKVHWSSSGPVPMKTHSRFIHVVILQQIHSHKKARVWLDARKTNIVITLFCPVWIAQGVHANYKIQSVYETSWMFKPQ